MEILFFFGEVSAYLLIGLDEDELLSTIMVKMNENEWTDIL